MVKVQRLKRPSGDDLKVFLRLHGLRREDVSVALHVTKNIVDRWCLPDDSDGHRDIPLASWELLLAKMGVRPLEPLPYSPNAER